MSEIRSVLRDYVGDVSAGGTRRDTRKFMQRLESIRSSAHTRHWLLVGALGCVFVLGLVLMWMYRENIMIVSGIFAATGLSTGVVIARLTRIWKELTFLIFSFCSRRRSSPIIYLNSCLWYSIKSKFSSQ